MKEKKILEEEAYVEEIIFTEEEREELRKKLQRLTPGAREPTTEAGWALLAAQGLLKEAWEREPIPLPD